jgi:hypothetical protein
VLSWHDNSDLQNKAGVDGFAESTEVFQVPKKLLFQELRQQLPFLVQDVYLSDLCSWNLR